MSIIKFPVANSEISVVLTTEGHAIKVGNDTIVLDAIQFADLITAINRYTFNAKRQNQRTWLQV